MSYDFSSLDEQKATPKQAQSKYDFSSLDPAPQSHVEASLYNASFANPVEASGRLDAANKLKTYLGEDWAPSVVDPAEAQRRLRIAENDHVLRNSPALSRKFIESGYAERTFDDLKPLSGVEAAVKSVFGVAKQSGSAVASSLWSANSGLWGLGRMAADVVGTVLPDDTANEISGWFAGYQKATGKTAQEMLGDPKDQGFTERSVYQGLQSLGQNLLTLPAAILSGGSSAALLPMVGMTGGSEYGKARDKGVSIPNAMVYGASQAAVEYATEKLPVTKFLGDIKAGTPFMQMLMKQVAYEVPGEQVATLLQDLNEWAVVNPEKSFASYVEERPSAAASTLIATIVGVGGQVSTVKGVETLVGAVTGKDKPFADPLVLKANAAERTLQAEQTLTQLIDAVAGTQSIQRNPQDVADLISEADDSGQTEVFINARQFANVFNQSAIETADRLGIDTQTLNDALASNGDLTVPLASLATTVAQDEALRPILEHTRVDPGDMSPSEARLWQSSQGEQFKAEAEAVLAQRQADEVYQTEVQGVYDNLLGQLNTARRFTPQVNERYAALTRDFYVTMADRAGMSVSEMAARYPLRVQAQGVGGLEQGAIESPEFRNWFGESKVVDAGGKPLVLTHTTNSPWEVFDMDKARDSAVWGKGIYLSFDTPWKGEKNSNAMKLYVKAENILDVTQPLTEEARAKLSAYAGREVDAVPFFTMEKRNGSVTAGAKAAGFDGIIHNGPGGTGKHLVVFDPTQIKSAIGNNGNYDPNDANILNQSAVPPAPTSGAVLNQSQPAGEGFEKWSHGHRVVTIDESQADEFKAGEGVVVEALHGTTGDFDTFQKQFANIESDLGGGFYFTNNPADVGENYAGLGPDLTNKVEIESERLAQQEWEDDDQAQSILQEYLDAEGIEVEVTEDNLQDMREQYGEPALYFAARKKFMANQGTTMPVFVRFDNPVVLGGSKETFLDYEESYDEETEEYGDPTGSLIDFVEALREVGSDERYDADIEQAIGDLMERAMDNGGLKASEIIEVLSSSEGLQYATDYEADGKLANKEIIRQAFSGTGFDGFIDQTVNQKFGSEKRIGSQMEGMDENTVHFIAFNDTQIKSRIGNNGEYSETDPSILKQDARGSFDPTTNTIALLDGADLSTFLHESGHFFLEVMADMATRPDAAPVMRADFDTLLAWFGVTGTPEADAATTWHLMSLEEKRQFHEQFARGFEAYLFEGTAPSVEMQGIFQRFRAWLTNVYESLKALDVTLTDDVRGVFDRMLASDEAIKTAEAVRNFAPVFQTPEQAGMTAEEWAQYQGEAKEASDNAVSELQTRSIRDMRWLANAKARKIKDLQATAKAVRNDVMMDVRREVLSEPIYMAWQFLTGKNPDKIAKPEKLDPTQIDPRKDTLLVAIAKMGGLDREQAVKEWGMDSKDDTKADNPGGKTMVTRKGGMGIDDMRLALEEWGYLPDSNDPDTDPKIFEEMFFDALRGGEYYSQWGEEAMIAAEERKTQRDPEEGITLENTPSGKLNTGTLREMYGTTDTAPWRLLSALKMTSPEGFHPDIVANLFGFSSGDELVRRLAVAEDPKIVIEAMTDQRMLEQHGDLASEADIERAAERAIHNDVRARVLTRELNALRKATGQAPIMLKAARLHADTWLARQLVKNATRHAPHAAAESRSAKATMDALAKGDTASAAIHKRDQVLNNQLARGALRAQDEVEKAVRYLKKFDKKGTRKALDQQYLDQIDQLLERFDLRAVSGKALQKRASLAGWLAEQESLGLDPVIDGRLIEDAQRQHYSTLTLEEFRGLIDSVKSIEHLGRLKHQLLTAKDKREFAKVVAELSQSVVDNANRDVTTVNAITPLEKGAKLLRGFSAMHRKFASIIREMDGGKDGGPMWEYLVRTMNEAGDKEVSLRGTMSERFAAVFAGLKGIKLNEKVFVPELNISLRREELLSIALNSGNEGNLQRLMDGGINDSLRAVSGQQLMGLLNRLSNKEWDFVEGVWSMIAINRPAIAAQEKALTGVEPKWVEPSPFTLQSGRVIMGGYYPAKYNADMSTRSNELEAITDLRQQMQGAAGRASTRNGYAKERAEAVAGRPLRLDLGVIAQHINEVTHRLSWQAWLIDARRIIAAPAVDRAIRDHYGPEILDQMRRQLKDIAAGDNGPTDAMDKVMNHLRNGTTIAGMGWNIMTSLMQPIGLTQSIERVGAGWVAKGLGQFVVSPFEITKDVHERSSFMRDRAKTINREINDVLNTIRSERMSKVEGSYFYLIQKFQQMVDVPTWLGAYEKAVAEGNNDERAISLADQAVIDSQGGGQLKDLSAIQRGGSGQKLFTNFYSFFNTTYQRAVENYRVTEFSNPLMVGRLAANYLLLFTVPVVWGWALKEALRGDDDEEDAEEIAKRLAMEQINYLLGTMVLAREIGSAISGFAGYQGPAGTRFFAEVAKLTKQIAQGDVDGALVKAAANTVGVVAHLPSGQVVKSVEGTVEFMDGNAGPQAVLVGPPLKN